MGGPTLDSIKAEAYANAQQRQNQLKAFGDHASRGDIVGAIVRGSKHPTETNTTETNENNKIDNQLGYGQKIRAGFEKNGVRFQTDTVSAENGRRAILDQLTSRTVVKNFEKENRTWNLTIPIPGTDYRLAPLPWLSGFLGLKIVPRFLAWSGLPIFGGRTMQKAMNDYHVLATRTNAIVAKFDDKTEKVVRLLNKTKLPATLESLKNLYSKAHYRAGWAGVVIGTAAYFVGENLVKNFFRKTDIVDLRKKGNGYEEGMTPPEK